MVAASKLTPTKKLHMLTPWDGKTSGFPNFNEDHDVQQLTSTYRITFVTEAGSALFVYYIQKRDDARAAGIQFNDKIPEWTDGTITPAQLAELDTHFKLRSQGNSITKLQVMQTTVIKDTFRVVDTKKYSNLDYTSEADFKASIQSTLEGNQLEITKFFVDRLQTATFPNGTTNDCAVRNCILRLILFDLLITKIMKKGFMPDYIVLWYARQWLHPVLQLWFKILLNMRE
eukprot:2121592-Rhodomonas_salina.1